MTDWVLPGVFGGLGVLSVVSWSLIVLKGWDYRRTRRDWAAVPARGALAEVAGQGTQAGARRALQSESARLERGLDVLAAIAGAAPFLGLFGTVWGIMGTFRHIGDAGAVTLAVVAPGLSEALVSTAWGLAVAIPALVGHHLLTSRCRRLLDLLEDQWEDRAPGPGPRA